MFGFLVRDRPLEVPNDVVPQPDGVRQVHDFTYGASVFPVFEMFGDDVTGVHEFLIQGGRGQLYRQLAIKIFHDETLATAGNVHHFTDQV